MGLVSAVVDLDVAQLSAAVGERLVCVGWSRDGSTTFAVTPDAGGATWTNRVAEATLPLDDTARRSLGVAELVPASAVSAVTFTAAWSGGGGGTGATWLRVQEGGGWVFAGVAIADSGTGTVTTLATGNTPSVAAGDILLVAAAAIRSGGTAASAWSTTSVNPALVGGGNQLLDAFAGKGEGGNAGSVGYASLVGQAAQVWADILTIDTARMCTVALVVWVQASAGQTVAVGQPVETGAATTFGQAKQKAAGQSADTSTARPVATAKLLAAGRSAESDTAQPVARLKTTTVVQAAEAGTAQPVDAAKAAAVGQLSQVDLARSITPAGEQVVPVAQAAQTHAARPVAWAPKHRLAGQAAASGSAAGVEPAKAREVGRATGADLAVGLTAAETVTLGRVVTTGQAQSVTVEGLLVLAVGQATETGTAASLRPRMTIPRPDTGTAGRPSTGVVTRPDTGLILRP